MARALLLCCLLPAVLLLQGCDLAVTAAITYDAAVSSQEHGAYTEYLFATQAENKSLQQAGKPLLPIVPEKNWRADIYRTRLEYADYYTRQTSTNGTVHSFEVWKEIDYPIEQAKLRKLGAPIQRRGE
jgi:hypothetical protein